jgi:two-component system cell cycle response regulator
MSSDGISAGTGQRVILIDACEESREVLATRLRAQGYRVEPASDAATGADMALAAPPAAIVADLWMPSVSGVQICRLLRSEAATADVPVILRGETDDPKNRFWADRAGAAAYVVKGRMGDLVRALGKAISAAPEGDGFFVQLSGGSVDIRDRIAQHLDRALFDSVIAAEVRALASSGSFQRLFDLLSQLLSQLGAYRWLALTTNAPSHLGLHHHPKLGDIALSEARQALEAIDVEPFVVSDEDALSNCDSSIVITAPVVFAGQEIGRLALSVPDALEVDASSLLPLVARELGGALRMTALVEESQRQASTDILTGIMNRRAFLAAMEVEIARSVRHGYPLCVMLMDVDHFKAINDRRGHASGDRVLAAMGSMLGPSLRRSDLAARWGGEEFVVALTSTELDGGRVVAERVRLEIERMIVLDGKGEPIPVTASVGLACLLPGEDVHALVDRADKAMYAAKVGGRNRLVVDEKRERTASASFASRETERRSEQATPEATTRKGAWS